MVQIVLVDETKKIDPVLLHSAALSLNAQVTQDLPSQWSGISANVSWAPSLSSVPQGSWPVFLVRELPPGEGGFHLDKHNQPYAKVIASPDDQTWTIDASHEIVEMLVDPYGNRMHSSQAIAISGDGVKDAEGVFNYLVEACDPCEANNFAYDITGIEVSDFITPHFYDATVTPGTLYSFRGNVTRPRELLKGGYISYIQADGNWNQILWVNPGPPQYNNPGIADGARSMRLAIHDAMGAQLNQAKHHQRRKVSGLSAKEKDRIQVYHDFRHQKDREKRLRAWYELAA
jgi:hypothetical protein